MRSQTLTVGVEQIERISAAGVCRARTGFRSWSKLHAALLLLAPMLIFIVFKQLSPLTDPDYWWHLRTGQYIFETGVVPRADIYSYTAAEQPWVEQEWLTELLMYLVSRHFGYVGNVALFSLVSVLTWLTTYRTCRRWGMGELGSVILMTAGFAMAMVSTNVRPQMVTALLLALTASLVTRYKQGEKWTIWVLPPLLALWANLHAGFIIGLALLALTLAGETFAAKTLRAAAPLKPLFAVTALSALATLLNPNGLDAHLYPLTYLSTGNSSMQYVVEWQSPNFHLSAFLVFALSLLLAMILGLGRRPLGTTEALWSLLLALMALHSVRNIALYAVVVIPLLAARLQTELPSLRDSLAQWRRPALLSVTWAVLIASIVGTLASADRRAALQLNWEPSSAGYPVGAVEYLRTHDLGGNLFNEYRWGGYLIYALYPQRPVFVDGRIDPYSSQLIESYVAVTSLRPNWQQVLDEYGVGIVLVTKDSPVAVALSENANWREAYAGTVEKLFVRGGQ